MGDFPAMKALPWLIMLLLATTGCRRSRSVTSIPVPAANTLVAGTLIKAPGHWSYRDARITRDLTVTLAGTGVNWSLSRRETMPHGGSSGGSSSSSFSLASPGDPWFIYIEDPETFWFHDGTKNLNYTSLANGGMESGYSINGGHLSKTGPGIPIDVVNQLPPELRRLVPKVEAPEKIPSF